jgi:DNA-binding YbaB/EbfC family protein
MAKGMGDMMKQVAKMQRKMEEIQKELAETTVEGSAGGGMVKVTANGNQDIISIKIEREVVNPDDVEMLEELVLSAVNQAKEKAAELQAQSMGSLTGGLNIPGLNLPF